MTFEYYLNAIQQLQIQINSLDQPIDCRLLRSYVNVVTKAKKEYPEYFHTWKVSENFGCTLVCFNEPVGILLSNSASPFK